jgi:hypothetical protein
VADDKAIEVIEVKVARIASNVGQLRAQMARIRKQTNQALERLNVVRQAMEALLEDRKKLLCQMRGLRSFGPCVSDRNGTIDMAADVCQLEALGLIVISPKAVVIGEAACLVAKITDKLLTDGVCRKKADNAFDAC